MLILRDHASLVALLFSFGLLFISYSFVVNRRDLRRLQFGLNKTETRTVIVRKG